MIEVLKSKLHRAAVTEANINYAGSISISAELMAAANIYEYQKVLVVDINNGARFETYVIKSEKPGCVCLNGAAARLAHVGDLIIIMAFAWIEEKDACGWEPLIVNLDGVNKIADKEN
jgi:aspartate 1-decarboxylase